MNALTTIPPNVRSALYWISFVVGIGLGATQVGYQSAEAGFPVWLKVSLSVYAFLAATLGLTAASNTPSYTDVVEGDAKPPREVGASDLVVLAAVGLLALVILIAAGVIR